MVETKRRIMTLIMMTIHTKMIEMNTILTIMIKENNKKLLQSHRSIVLPR